MTTLALISTLLLSTVALAGGGSSGFPDLCELKAEPLQSCSVHSLSAVNTGLLNSLSQDDQKEANDLLQAGNQFTSMGCAAGVSFGVISAPGYGRNYDVNVYDANTGSLGVELNSGATKSDHMPRVQTIEVIFRGHRALLIAHVFGLNAEQGLRLQSVPLATATCR